MSQCQTTADLQHIRQGLLHTKDFVFPLTVYSHHEGHELVSLKKIQEGDGMWTHRKVILGCIFDGIGRCIDLPTDKRVALLSDLKNVGRKSHVQLAMFKN